MNREVMAQEDSRMEEQSYLSLLARAGLHPQIRRKIGVSDVVQATLMEAHRDREQFEGHTRAERLAWLRQILLRNLANGLRDLRRQRRDVDREQSLDAALQQSSQILDRCLVAEQSSPLSKMEKEEELLRLAQAVESLPEANREALVQRYWQGRSLREIGEDLGRTPPAIAGLLHRALVLLRSAYPGELRP